MIIIREKPQPLVEMAQFKGFGIIVEIRSDDHGKFGNKESPAHAHVLDGSKREIAQIALMTNKCPEKPADIIWHRTPNPPVGLGDRIVKLFKSPSKAAKKAGLGGTVWQSALHQWFVFHED